MAPQPFPKQERFEVCLFDSLDLWLSISALEQDSGAVAFWIKLTWRIPTAAPFYENIFAIPKGPIRRLGDFFLRMAGADPAEQLTENLDHGHSGFKIEDGENGEGVVIKCVGESQQGFTGVYHGHGKRHGKQSFGCQDQSGGQSFKGDGF